MSYGNSKPLSIIFSITPRQLTLSNAGSSLRIYLKSVTFNIHTMHTLQNHTAVSKMKGITKQIHALV